MHRDAVVKHQHVDLLVAAASEFEDWAEELSFAMENHFNETKSQITSLISDNNFILNRLAPLSELDKTHLKKQEIIVSWSQRMILKF